ncbi:anti-CBASS protein Acb1 family protein [Acidaminococcus massiliensis]|uniref:anti-CBASS protein Acb1 family protein n=1 Tax=Acidaminococcus massiliensis TaxID=1852375 RepID=UPI002064BF15|nr:anti-CBASS Acb1 family protein [Acidaminococcus massiliensis]DAY76349.1 MAG TPA: Portal [Caudoviricetes sp.]
MPRYKKKRQTRAIRGKAQDGFSNALARLGVGTPNLLEATEYIPQRITRNYALLNTLYREQWIVRRIVDTIPSDMLKNWITLSTEVAPATMKRFERALRQTRVINSLKEGMEWGRLFGGAIGVLIIKGQGDMLDQPLDLERILPGDFCGILNFDRWNGVSPSGELINDIGDPEYGLPKYYQISDPASGAVCNVHHSRVLRFIGDNLPYWESIAENQWGSSVIEAVFDDLKKRDNVSWNIAQLTFVANLRVFKMSDMGQLLSAVDEESKAELYRTIQSQNWLMSNMGLQIMDSQDSMETHQYTFGGLAEVYSQFMMDVAGAARIPVTKLFGRSPAGMNATGESDLQNYYDMIGEEQESKLRPILDKLLPVVCMSAFGAVPDDLDYDFDPVSEPNDKERAELAKSGTENVVAALNAGLVSKRTALKELKQQAERTGVWTNITEADIMRASEDLEDEGELGGLLGLPQPGRDSDEKWEEDKHPRAENGRFEHSESGSNEKDTDVEPVPERDPEDITNLLGEEFKGYKGNEAVDKLLQEKRGYIKDAFHNESFGDIALIYGDDGCGLCHIIKQRKQQGFTDEKIKSLLYNLGDVITHGTVGQSKNGKGTFEIFKDGEVAVISPTLRGNDFTFVLTAYKSRRKK